MNKGESQASSKKFNIEAFSLTPSAVVTMFEIDLANIAFDAGILNVNDEISADNYVFRFHNNVKLGKNSVYWKGQEYVAAPVHAEGFELNSQGTLPTPKLSITVHEEGIDIMTQFRQKMNQIGDLVGAKVTRIKTFAKFLDAENFLGEDQPDGWSPDPNVEFPREVYFIERKSLENKFVMEFQLSSIWDLEGIRLPGRTVVASRCVWTYRGHGCLYEYKSRISRVHYWKHSISSVTLPNEAPPVATVNNELIEDIINAPLVDKGRYELGRFYAKGHFVYIEKSFIKYYYVAKSDNPPVGPPSSLYWEADTCAKDVRACSLRWETLNNGQLPFGGFPSVNKYN